MENRWERISGIGRLQFSCGSTTLELSLRPDKVTKDTALEFLKGLDTVSTVKLEGNPFLSRASEEAGVGFRTGEPSGPYGGRLVPL